MGLEMGDPPIVLVTGASGYIATHLVRSLLQDGVFKVRGTVRSLKSEEKVRQNLLCSRSVASARKRSRSREENALILSLCKRCVTNMWLETSGGVFWRWAGQSSKLFTIISLSVVT